MNCPTRIRGEGMPCGKQHWANQCLPLCRVEVSQVFHKVLQITVLPPGGEGILLAGFSSSLQISRQDNRAWGGKLVLVRVQLLWHWTNSGTSLASGGPITFKSPASQRSASTAQGSHSDLWVAGLVKETRTGPLSLQVVKWEYCPGTECSLIYNF